MFLSQVVTTELLVLGQGAHLAVQGNLFLQDIMGLMLSAAVQE